MLRFWIKLVTKIRNIGYYKYSLDVYYVMCTKVTQNVWGKRWVSWFFVTLFSFLLVIRPLVLFYLLDIRLISRGKVFTGDTFPSSGRMDIHPYVEGHSRCIVYTDSIRLSLQLLCWGSFDLSPVPLSEIISFSHTHKCLSCRGPSVSKDHKRKSCGAGWGTVQGKGECPRQMWTRKRSCRCNCKRKG